MAIITDGVRTRFTDDTGLPLIGGQVFSYVEGTSTPKDTYQDRAFTIPNTNPIILDDVGSCQMYLKGGYRLRVLTADGALVEEKDNAFQSDGQVLDVVANTTAIAALQTNVDVLNTRGGLKTDENNHIIGQGKAESATVYDLSLRSDKVRVSAPTDIEFGDLVFKTYGAPTVVNGVTIPKGTFLNPALVVPLLGTAASRLVGTGAEQIPLSKDIPSLLGTAATKNVGTAYGQVPLADQIPSLLGTAATKNVGTAEGNVMEVGAFGLGSYASLYSTATTMEEHITKMGTKTEFIYSVTPAATGIKPFEDYSMGFATNRSGDVVILGLGVTGTKCGYIAKLSNGNETNVTFWTDKNATKDPNGFLKGASPIAEIYSDKMDLNEDAQKQGGITFEKLGTGNYLVKGSLGFAKEGWYIETPKDANGNVLVAVVYEQLANNDISVKTYAKRFDEETGDIVPNLAKPRDIPDGRFISLRLHELPKEPPVMQTSI